MTSLLQEITNAHRKSVRLADVATIVPGFAFKSADFSDHGVPVVKITEIHSPYVNFDGCSYVDASKYQEDKLDKFYLHEGEYVIAMTGATIGKVGKMISKTKSLLNQRVAVVRPKSFVSREFIELQVASSAFQAYIKQIASGSSAQANISGDNIGAFGFPLPDLPIQHKIAEILVTYDAKVENNNSIIKILESMTKVIFDEWFVVKSSPTWRECKLGDVIELSYGKALKAEDRDKGQYPVVGSSGIVGHHKEALVKGPGIVVGRKGNVGSVIWINSDFYPIDTTFYVVTELDLYFCLFLLKKQVFHSGDSAVPGLNREVAYSNDVLIPPIELQKKFGRIVKSFFDQISDLEKENAMLDGTKRRLLSELI